MPRVSLPLAFSALLVLAAPAFAQSLGGAAGGGSAGGVGSSSSVGGSSLGGSAGGGVSPSLGGASNTVGSSGGVLGSSATSTQQRATAGSTTINSVNADAVARSGNIGAATTIGGTGTTAAGTNSSGFQSIGGTGPAALYRIPRPRVNVDLTAIRSALRQGPNATPDARGY